MQIVHVDFIGNVLVVVFNILFARNFYFAIFKTFFFLNFIRFFFKVVLDTFLILHLFFGFLFALAVFVLRVYFRIETVDLFWVVATDESVDELGLVLVGTCLNYIVLKGSLITLNG